MRSFVMKHPYLCVILLAVSVFMVTTAESCNTSAPQDQQRAASINTRAAAFARAEAAVPIPKTVNFPIRKALAEMTSREDLTNHPWYIYLLGDNGNTIGYYVAKYPPVNACNFLGSTQDVKYDSDGNLILQAPSLDGVYYGAASCDWWVIFDAGTNAMIKIRGLKFYLADQPLALDAQPIKVKRSP